MIEVSHIHKAFPGKEVLKGISFQVEKGSIYGLIGKNGAGKTTLMKIMTGLMSADAGDVSYGDEVEGKVGYLPDIPAFYEYLTTDEYLDFLLFEKNPIRRQKLLDFVGLKPNLRISTLSRGMRQRLGLAAVLVSDPRVILLDEPTSALDPAGRSDVKDLLMQLKNEGRTIILSTHILADMDSICDKAGFLHNGVIVKEVDVKQMQEAATGLILHFATEPDLLTLSKYVSQIYKKDDLTIKVVIDEEQKPQSQQKLFQGLAAQTAEITSIRSATPSLDQIFREVCV
ncbi:MAG: ABC transporter ATP-binding protein [Lachnospiraceae bacterium]|nr:ABC transporter ATP-binding protein [Lachnospiraceae bacterium]